MQSKNIGCSVESLTTGMTISKTAKLLNQTTSTTKKQLVRGKKMLLNLLGIKGDGNNGNEQR